jgi:hypothetical protein
MTKINSLVALPNLLMCNLVLKAEEILKEINSQ